MTFQLKNQVFFWSKSKLLRRNLRDFDSSSSAIDDHSDCGECFIEAKSSFCHLQNWNRNCRIATQLTKDRTKHVKNSKFYNLFDALKLTTFQSNRNYLEELWRAFWFFKSTWGRHFNRGSTLCLPNERNNIFKQFPRGQEKNLYLKMIDTLQKHGTF